MDFNLLSAAYVVSLSALVSPNKPRLPQNNRHRDNHSKPVYKNMAMAFHVSPPAKRAFFDLLCPIVTQHDGWMIIRRKVLNCPVA